MKIDNMKVHESYLVVNATKIHHLCYLDLNLRVKVFLRDLLHERKWFTSRLYQKLDHSNTWLGKIVNSSKNYNLNYESGLTHQGELVHFAGPHQFT